MTNLKRKIPKEGDVLEIPLGKTFAYAQFINDQPPLGSLLARLGGIYNSRPDDLDELVQQKELYFFISPIRIFGSTLKRRGFE